MKKRKRKKQPLTEERLLDKLIKFCNNFIKKNKRFYPSSFENWFFNLEEKKEAKIWITKKIEEGVLNYSTQVFGKYKSHCLCLGKDWYFSEKENKWLLKRSEFRPGN